jgi:putative phosphonate catabolism associated alcohol dehydrogenase
MNDSHARAMLFHGPGQPFQSVNLPLPTDLAPDELLVEVSLATICGSDLHTVSGRRKEKTPSILGHEAVGRIVIPSPSRPELKIGERITWSLVDSCGCCTPCVEWDLPQKCVRWFKYGHETVTTASGLHGCFSTHIVLRPGTTVVSLPDNLPDAAAAPANCALATIMAATESLPASCQSAWVQGCGLLGLYACAVLRSRGVSRIYASDPVESRRIHAARFGAIPIDAMDVNQIPHNHLDFVLEVAGTPTVVPDGILALRPGGWYVFAGLVLPGPSLALSGETILRKCLTLRGIHNYAPRHLHAAIDFLKESQKEQRWEQLVSPPLSLMQINEAFASAASGQWPRVAVAPSINS